MDRRADEIGWPAIRRHPGFRAAVEANAAAIAGLHDGENSLERWLANDMGRVAVTSRMFFALARSGDVSIADVLAKTLARGTSSEGRVLQVIRRAEKAQWVRIERLGRSMAQRRIVVLPRLIERYQRRMEAELETAALAVPALGPALASMRREGFLLSFLSNLARFDGGRDDLRGPPTPAMRYFLQAEAGLRILYALIGAQAPGRLRLLDRAPLSKRALAQRFQVSRIHVARLIAAAAEAGWLSLASPSVVVFSEQMNEEAEIHFARTFFAVASSARLATAEIAPADRVRRGAAL